MASMIFFYSSILVTIDLQVFCLLRNMSHCVCQEGVLTASQKYHDRINRFSSILFRFVSMSSIVLHIIQRSGNVLLHSIFKVTYEKHPHSLSNKRYLLHQQP